RLRHLLKSILTHKTFFQDFEIEHDFPIIGKRTVLLNARMLVQKNKNNPMILLAIEDVTEKKHIERQKDDFISIASHELKTPVTSMKAYTHLLQKHPLITNDKKASYMLEKLDLQMNRLTELVASFMNVYKIRTGKLRLKKQRFQLEELISEVVGNFQYTISSHIVEHTDDVKVKVYADKARIHQVLVNLISNAIKYSPDADKVKVSKKIDKDKVVVSVQDFGMGIPKEEQNRIYERFFRTKRNREGSIPGLGLGLFISTEIIKQHGGELWMKSIEGKGSTFYFSLQIKPT
ncbi:hypothetical protein COU88_00545, partial [Candidatus Roizmanbacteria bacterium CG10_big_fil_rev_8_21_14_0_10_39_6]